MLSFHWLEKCVIVKKQKKTQVIWDFPDTSDQFVNPESAAWVKSTSIFCGKLQSFFFSGEGSKSVKSTYDCIQAIPAPQSTDKYENGCSTENDAQDIGVNQDTGSTNDARVLLSNDLVRFQLQECLQECVAGSFMCLENDDDLTSAHITEDLFEKGDGPADHTPCCKPVRVDLVDTDIAEANSNEEYAFIFSQ